MTEFYFREYDLSLSLRYYFLTTRFRKNETGNDRALPYLYPDMQNDENQWGIRLGNLYTEEKIPTYPCIGIMRGSLVDNFIGYDFNILTYGFFLDAVMKVEDSYGSFDRELTFIQQENMASDLRILLTEEKYSRNIPYYIFNENDGTITKVDGHISIIQNPVPRIVTSTTRPSDIATINATFQVDVFLKGAKVE